MVIAFLGSMGRIMAAAKVSLRAIGRFGLIMALIASTLVPAAPAHAAQLTSRKLTLSSSAASGTDASNVTYTVSYTHLTLPTIYSV